jgi:hypothetical protein
MKRINLIINFIIKIMICLRLFKIPFILFKKQFDKKIKLKL